MGEQVDPLVAPKAATAQPSFASLEARIESWLEGSVLRWFNAYVSGQQLLVDLIQALESHTSTMPNGRRIAPHQFTVQLSPPAADYWQPYWQNFGGFASQKIFEYAQENGILLSRIPSITLQANPQVQAQAIQVHVVNDAVSLTTEHLALTVLPQTPLLPDAYLILANRSTIPLQKPVLSIGRALNNDIVIPDTRVSRQHAQLRFRFGRWIIYDFDSTGGTWVNKIMVQESVLHSGDVISLGGFQMIYNCYPPAPQRTTTDTAPINPKKI